MTNLTEKSIIQIIQKKLNKEFVPEDVEEFRLGNINFLAKTDTLVQSTDIPPKMRIKDAVRKSIVACISDFASKGTRPQFGIISINFPKKTSKPKVEEIANTIKLSSKEFGLKILGGDINEGKEFVFQVCIFGQADTIPKRKGAKIGDFVFVSGNFGYTGTGLEIMLNSKKASTKLKKKAIKAVIHPIPRLEFGIKNKKYFTSSMDSSDGLSTTLNEMARQSQKKIVIDNIPAKKEIYEFAKQNNIDPTKLIFHSGEEYEVVFTVSKNHVKKIIQRAKITKTPLIQIGRVSKGNGVFVKKNDSFYKLRDLGWKHFR